MSSQEEIWTQLRRVFVEFFDDEAIVLEANTTAGEVEGWDSMTTVELMIELEREFGIRFRTGEMADLENVGQLVDRISARLGS